MRMSAIPCLAKDPSCRYFELVLRARCCVHLCMHLNTFYRVPYLEHSDAALPQSYQKSSQTVSDKDVSSFPPALEPAAHANI